MAESYGINFSPMSSDGQNKAMQRPGQPQGGGVQDAIRTLSLKIPRVTGAQGIAPSPLLQAPGGQAAPMGTTQQPGFNGDFLQAILKMLGLTPGGMNDAGMAGGAAPTPRVIPGVGAGEPAPGSGTPGGINTGPSIATSPINWADVLKRGGVTGRMGDQVPAGGLQIDTPPPPMYGGGYTGLG